MRRLISKLGGYSCHLYNYHMEELRNRAVVEHLTPEVDGGRFYAKGIVGRPVTVECDLFADGHDVVNGRLLVKHETEKKWRHLPIQHVGNDRWSALFVPEKVGLYTYTVEGWVDHALNWQHNLERKLADGQQVNVELRDGIEYLNRLPAKLPAADKNLVARCKQAFAAADRYQEAVELAAGKELHDLFVRYPHDVLATRHPERQLFADRERATFSAWYEFFPRSAGEDGRHGTFRDCIKRLSYVSEMGFDVLYLPPVHPIGVRFRKGRNNATTAAEGDVGSPWAIGAKEGGHRSLHPDLGTERDFMLLLREAKAMGIEIAMDFALQCSPDHPYIKEKPQWFKWRSDGSIQYAENPPKKYQDIVPLNFECDDWQNLWDELVENMLFWVDKGVTIFRVDNPHTKPFRFWEYLIARVKARNPEVLFLSEAFTRPKIMHQLAKCGFSQSYTYYTWRNTPQEIKAYLHELISPPGVWYFRPNFWPNTPDILPYALQTNQPAVHYTRFFMAATLSSNYGIYGPVFEERLHDAVPGKEEYLDSEKYEVRSWNWEVKGFFRQLIKTVNEARRKHASLQQTESIVFCETTSEHIFAYLKQSADGTDSTLMVVNLDPYYPRNALVRLPWERLGGQHGTAHMHDLITGNVWPWQQEWNFVELSPNVPMHLFHVTVTHG